MAGFFLLLSSMGMIILFALFAPHGFGFFTELSAIVVAYQLAMAVSLTTLTFSIGGILKSRGVFHLPAAIMLFTISGLGFIFLVPAWSWGYSVFSEHCEWMVRSKWVSISYLLFGVGFNATSGPLCF